MNKNEIYYYKDKPYAIFEYAKSKVNGQWVDVVVYKSLSKLDAGYLFVRGKAEFFQLFKTKTQMNENITPNT